jgi:hypothetical protein
VNRDSQASLPRLAFGVVAPRRGREVGGSPASAQGNPLPHANRPRAMLAGVEIRRGSRVTAPGIHHPARPGRVEAAEHGKRDDGERDDYEPGQVAARQKSPRRESGRAGTLRPGQQASRRTRRRRARSVRAPRPASTEAMLTTFSLRRCCLRWRDSRTAAGTARNCESLPSPAPTITSDFGSTMRVPAGCSTINGPGRIRTCDLGIKSPLLCQLSYRPAESM